MSVYVPSSSSSSGGGVSLAYLQARYPTTFYMNTAIAAIPKVEAYDVATTYLLGGFAVYSDVLYESLAGSNVGNQPDISPLSWSPAVTGAANATALNTASTIVKRDGAGGTAIGALTASSAAISGTLGVTGRTTTAGLTNSLGLNFATATTKMLALTDAGTATDLTQHNYDGFGAATNTVRYQAKAITTNHVFSAATSSSTSNTLMTVGGNGVVSVPKILSVAGGNKSIVLYDPGSVADATAYNYNGFGTEASQTSCYLNATSNDFVFYAATSAVARNELFRVKGTGAIQATGSITCGSVIAPSVSTTTNQVSLTQTGDSMGSSAILVRNRAGLNGCLVQQLAPALDLCDIGLYIQFSAQTATLRLEKRTASLSSASNNTSGELQFRPDTTLPTNPFCVGYGQCTVAPTCLLATGAITASGMTTLQKNLSFNNQTQNKLLALFDNPALAADQTMHTFYGFGVQPQTFRYQVPAAGDSHVFYSSSVATPTVSAELFRIAGTGAVTAAGRITTAGMTNSLGLNFTTATTKMLALTDAGSTTDLSLHTYDGLGAATNTVRYQAKATTTNHVFTAATSSSASNTLMTVGGNGLVTIPKILTMGQTGNRKEIVLWEGGTSTNTGDHLFAGFGLSGAGVVYQLNGTGGGHIFYAATGASTSNTLFSINGDGTIVTTGTFTSGTITSHGDIYADGGLTLGDQIITLGAITASGDIDFGSGRLLSSTVRVFDIASGAATSLFVGPLAGNTTGTGTWNTGIGYNALKLITIGESNTGLGYNALTNNLSGFSNTAGGFQSLATLSTAHGNTAFGSAALFTANGDSNTAIGIASMNTLTTGSYNTAIGATSGQTVSTGTYNTLLGYSANTVTGGLTNATAIGNGAVVTASNKIQLGNASVTSVVTSGSYVAGSDGEFGQTFTWGAPLVGSSDFLRFVRKNGVVYFSMENGSGLITATGSTGLVTADPETIPAAYLSALTVNLPITVTVNSLFVVGTLTITPAGVITVQLPAGVNFAGSCAMTGLHGCWVL